MSRHLFWLFVFFVFGTGAASAQEPCSISFTGTVPEGPETHFYREFEVPEGEGIVEIEVQHDDLSSANILDWGHRV